MKIHARTGIVRWTPPKDEEITRLKLEIDSLKERLNSNLDTSYAESEAMSSSTVSRSEDINRMRDLEGSWEERYGKLRNLAIKLKGKVRELTNTLTKEQVEKEEMQKKLSANLKTIQTLQSQSDKLEDALENTKQECKQYLHRLNTIAEDISKDKQALVSKDDLISELNKEVEALKKEKVTTDNWKKQVGAKVQTLRKELQTINLVKKEYEEKITKLLVDSEAKEQALRAEVDSHKQTKSMLDASNNDCKRNSLLSLEMQDYERSVKETAKKLEKQREQVTKLKGQIDSQKSTINALREQNKILEEKVREADDNFNTATAEINTYKKKDARLEEEVARKEDQIHSLTQLLETSRSESEELSTELSKVIAEHQKTNAMLKNERDLLRSQTLGLQQNLRDAQDALKLKEDELRVILTEYEGYKVRAQSVLRQNQIRNIGLEEKLAEEVADLKVRNAQLNSDLEKTIDRIRALEEANDCLSFEKEESFKHVQELEMDVEEIKTQYAQLSNKYQTTVNEHTETVKSLRLHADTLSQCYRQQIAEQEVRHNKEIVELQIQERKARVRRVLKAIIPPKIYPVPLERLLGSDSDQELVHVRKQLVEQESKLLHLTALLADTEQDLAKHVQMNKLLKEEIRRQQRSEEREKHAENLEYLKNVVFKFVTLHSGDERSRMVPVLNTILKLSPEETQKLNIVARGDSGIKGWTNYLPTWSSPNKP
ncbi:hypothetical protein NQ315_016318 [Exocentrus adspersus]|uniref:GRIP domain-containing protein n=1 Tax=Exocentrus adspersus TaxID=1586481 RepID=A0AAV8VPS2_9CUCU|nr:hypothetical protein NQ315_016318 [Exocentrus adspersus]